ncbi:MAG: pantetheine-phosphate adenylyltransferase [Magnetococcales bacterium]|nr:pantetheine-phosphate adenylyltransferase [Magnetococcales bacterium]
MIRTAVYPGTFDPITLGHLDIITRGLHLFGHLVVAVAASQGKRTLFSLEERLELVRRSVQDLPGVEVDCLPGLLVDYVSRREASVVLRGLRAVSDFEYEFQMVGMNRKLAPGVETVFLMAGESTTFIASHLIREVASMGGDVGALVPPPVVTALQRLIREKPAT